MLTMDEQSTSASQSGEPSTALVVAPPGAAVEPAIRDAMQTGGDVSLREIISQTFDGLDELADAVAQALGLRGR